MRTQNQSRWGFTLVELLTVIAIIGILAALLLPVLALIKKKAQMKQAALEISQIVTAIQSFDSSYSRPPISASAQAAANPDFTYGGVYQTPNGGTWPSPIPANYQANNSDVFAILMVLTNYPGTSTPTININNQVNPKQTIFLKAKMSGDTKSPGVGSDLIYRDPWGNPYVITLDLNYNELCEDAFYQSSTVSTGGLSGLILQPDGKYAYRGNVMVWSAGPDGKIDPTAPANQGANKDNILSWK